MALKALGKIFRFSSKSVIGRLYFMTLWLVGFAHEKNPNGYSDYVCTMKSFQMLHRTREK